VKLVLSYTGSSSRTEFASAETLDAAAIAVQNGKSLRAISTLARKYRCWIKTDPHVEFHDHVENDTEFVGYTVIGGPDDRVQALRADPAFAQLANEDGTSGVYTVNPEEIPDEIQKTDPSGVVEKLLTDET